MTTATTPQAIRNRLNAALAQAEQGDFSELAFIVDALTHADASVRLRAAYVCQRIGSASAVAPLSKMATSDPASENRNQAICALATIGALDAVPALIAALDDEDGERREDARAALYQLLGDAVLRLTADEVDGPDPAERERVADWWQQHEAGFDPALVYAFGEPASPAVFIRRIKSARSMLPDAYLDALRDWTGQDFGQKPLTKTIAKWDAWWEAHAGDYARGRRYFYGRAVPS